MDASRYKDYVLTLLFMKYVSDKYAGKTDGVIEVPAGGSFADMVKLKGDKGIGDKINKIIGRLAEANDLKGVIDQVANDRGRSTGGRNLPASRWSAGAISYAGVNRTIRPRRSWV
jgi:type I restriction enzyme M protein